MRILIIFTIAASFLIPCTLLASVYQTNPALLRELGISDETLQQLAREKGFVPQTLDEVYSGDDAYGEEPIEVWFFLASDEKISLIDEFIEQYIINGIYITQEPSYYRDQVNAFIYRHILKQEETSFDYDGIKDIFTLIAVMDGDYNDGRDRIMLLKEHLGDEGLNWFITIYPDKYKHLLYLQRETFDHE